MKFHENPSSGSGVVPMRTDGRTDGWTDMTKLTVAFLNFASAPKNNMSNTYAYFSYSSYLELDVI